MTTASPTKLRNGTWGARVPGGGYEPCAECWERRGTTCIVLARLRKLVETDGEIHGSGYCDEARGQAWALSRRTVQIDPCGARGSARMAQAWRRDGVWYLYRPDGHPAGVVTQAD